MTIDYDLKLEKAKEAVKQEPYRSSIWNAAALAFASKQDYETAIRCLRMALGLHALEEPHDLDFDILLHHHLTRLHAELGQDDLASDEAAVTRRLVEQKEATMVDDADHWRDVGLKWAGIDHDEAIRCYERAVSIDPTNQHDWSYLAWLYFDKQDFANAKRCYEAALVALQHGDGYHAEQTAAGFWHNLASVDDAMGDAAGAEECRQKEREMQDAFARTRKEELRKTEASSIAREQEFEAEIREEAPKDIGAPLDDEDRQMLELIKSKGDAGIIQSQIADDEGYKLPRRHVPSILLKLQSAGLIVRDTIVVSDNKGMNIIERLVKDSKVFDLIQREGSEGIIQSDIEKECALPPAQIRHIVLQLEIAGLVKRIKRKIIDIKGNPYFVYFLTSNL